MAQRKGLFWGVSLGAVAAAAVVYLQARHRDSALPYNAALRPSLALVVAGPDAFHQQVIAGAEQASKDFDADLHVDVPDGTGSGQTAALVACATQKIDGLAVSPLAPDDQTSLLSRLATQMKVVTYDNDLPGSLRHAYVGANNVMGGRLAADLVKRALPEGGQIAIFIGDNERQNAQTRRQSLMNALRNLRDAAEEESQQDLEKPTEAGKYSVVGTFLDGSDPQKALANAEQVLRDHQDLQGMVALYGYNGPACLKALKAAGKLKQVRLIAFDEHDATLAGIEDGSVVGAVVQDPYLMGYKTIEELCRLCRNDVAALPLPGMGSFTLACAVVDQDNLAQFRENAAKRLAEQTKKTKPAPAK